LGRIPLSGAAIPVARTTCCPGDLAPARSQEAASNTPLLAAGFFISYQKTSPAFPFRQFRYSVKILVIPRERGIASAQEVT
jgi:hypothetical protein